MKDLKAARGDKAYETALPSIRQEIRDATVQRLKDRKNRLNAPSIQDAWIREEALEAAKAVTARYQTVIGDVSLIGRSPDTVSGEDEFLRTTKPLAVPSVKTAAGQWKAPGDIQADAHNWTADAMSRLALPEKASAGTQA